MKRFTIFKSHQRGHFKFPILETRHSFSFGNWYEPTRFGFGALKVLNDDIFEPSQGIGMHPHENMEIITIPLEGSVKHKDSSGGSGIIEQGEIQVMSAGYGVMHSEFNNDNKEKLKLFQIWIEPNKLNVEPRYEDKKIDFLNSQNTWKLLISPDSRDDSLSIYQNAFISIGNIDQDNVLEYKKYDSKNGVFLLNIEGQIGVSSDIFQDLIIDERDSLECENGIFKINIHSKKKSKVLIIEVPMNY